MSSINELAKKYNLPLMKIARKSPDFNPGMDRAFFYMCKFINSVVYFSIMNYNIST